MTPAVWLFGTTLFLSSFLMFLIEPMIARMVLPQLGGGPTVWNTCLVFFQTTILVGYACTHGATRIFGTRRWAVAYSLLLFLPWLVLPISISSTLLSVGGPALGLWLTLAVSVGLPFLALSMSAPGLQKWLSATKDPAARDPFFLYAASNFGSLLALLCYPSIIEPVFAVRTQARLWGLAYRGFVVLALMCAAVAWRSDDQSAIAASPQGRSPVFWRQRLLWLGLSAVPSSLLLGVTTYLSTDIAAVPLLWVVPLSLYLFTFVLAFSRGGRAWGDVADRRMPLLATALVVLIASGFGVSVWLILPLHLVAFATIALMCHSRLAAARPEPEHLTEFYLWIAVGGMVGGLFNTLAAPLLFSGPAEYPLMLVAACLLRIIGDGVDTEERRRDRLMDGFTPVAAGVLAAALVLFLKGIGANDRLMGAAFGLPGVFAFSQSRKPLRFALCLGAILVVAWAAPSSYRSTLHTERTFFGTYRVTVDHAGRLHSLYHGTTLHGVQAVDPRERDTPLTYYHPTGPIGQALSSLPQLADASNVAAVGLGVGSLSTYAKPGQRWTFYEIDAAVERIARNTNYFTHLEQCGEQCQVVIGDARLSLARATDERYDLIVLDAFSSDAIPVHLLTREAVALYLSRLMPHGVLAFHISNRHLSLGPVLARVSDSYHLVAIEQAHRISKPESEAGQSASDWVLMSRDPADLEPLIKNRSWTRLGASSASPLWTDDFSNILTVLKFSGGS